MQAFTTLNAVALPLARANVDTDQIVPARYLQKPRSDDFGHYLFRDLRDRPARDEASRFVLDLPAYHKAQIMVARDNFGCGSSREHAVWALYDYGFRVVIAPSFGDIFYGNALKNGFLPIVLRKEDVDHLLAVCEAEPGLRLQVDLQAQHVRAPDGSCYTFDIDGFARHCLLQGLDEIDYTLANADRIAEFEHRHRTW
jgi:3-isopropylmalate/(R)-2-methylmalate dehydratase small subunit